MAAIERLCNDRTPKGRQREVKPNTNLAQGHDAFEDVRYGSLRLEQGQQLQRRGRIHLSQR